MPRESKDAVKKSVAVDSATFDWVVDYGRRHGMDYTAAVNFLLAEAREEIEREDRIKASREIAYAEIEKRMVAEEMQKGAADQAE